MEPDTQRTLLVLTLMFWSCIGGAILSMDAAIIERGVVPPPPPLMQLVDPDGRFARR